MDAAVVSLRDDDGFTLIELLVGMVLSLAILTATLAVFNTTYRFAHSTGGRFDTAELARNALDTQARQLRNLAKRLNNTPVIDTVAGYDLIFQTSDPSRTWVRYCLDTTTAPATTSRGRLWSSALALDPNATAYAVTAGMRGTCPGTGWTKQEVVADWIVNRSGGRDRPLFAYRCTNGTSACTGSSTTFDQIVNVTAQTIVDSTPGTEGKELLVSSGVYLRNQNQVPEVLFAATATGSRTVVLNGSGSGDFEGRTLSMWWFKSASSTSTLSVACDNPLVTINAGGQRVLWGGVLIGDGITLSHTFPSGEASPQYITLVVCDPGDRFGSQTSRVTIPT